MFNWDGKADEVFIAVGYKFGDANGNIIQNQDPIPTPTMGDTWNLGGRVQAGSASDRGGIVTNDAFPTRVPWQRSRPLDPAKDYPPYKVWEGDLTQGQDIVFITPTIWEWDPGNSFWADVINWHVRIDSQLGQRAKDVFAGRWPTIGWYFDAVSLGIQTIGNIPNVWCGTGSPGNRPIGINRDPIQPNSCSAVLFNPKTLMMTYDTAEWIIRNDPYGKGPPNGILVFRYADDERLAGDYSLYLQVEKLPGQPPPLYPDLSLIKEAGAPEVYVIVGAAPFHVPDPMVLNRLYGGWGGVQTVPGGTIAQLPNVPQDGTLLREEHAPEVWRIEGGRKRHITTPDVLGRLGGWANVRVVPDNALANIPNGQPIV
jgi:hypothetical protein